MLFFMALISCVNGKDNFPEHLSMYALISAPEKHNGKVVKIYGYLNTEYEADAIYVSALDYKHALFKNAIALIIKYDSEHKPINRKFDLSKLNNKYVSLTGTFVNPEFGDSLFTGEIKNITEITIHELIQKKK